MKFAQYVYLITFIILAFLYIQPRITEYFDVKRKFKKNFNSAINLIDKHILRTSKYDFYQGKTKWEIDTIIEKLDEIKTVLLNEKSHKRNKKSYYEGLKTIEEVLQEDKKIMKMLEEVRRKEKVVLDYLEKLDTTSNKENKNIEEMKYIKDLSNECILKAYNYVQDFSRTAKI